VGATAGLPFRRTRALGIRCLFDVPPGSCTMPVRPRRFVSLALSGCCLLFLVVANVCGNQEEAPRLTGGLTAGPPGLEAEDTAASLPAWPPVPPVFEVPAWPPASGPPEGSPFFARPDADADLGVDTPFRGAGSPWLPAPVVGHPVLPGLTQYFVFPFTCPQDPYAVQSPLWTASSDSSSSIASPPASPLAVASPLASPPDRASPFASPAGSPEPSTSSPRHTPSAAPPTGPPAHPAASQSAPDGAPVARFWWRRRLAMQKARLACHWKDSRPCSMSRKCWHGSSPISLSRS
jgi:hypothetical protein